MLSCGLRLGVATVELAVADDAFALGADVDEDLVLVDADDGALDDVAVLEALDVGVLLREQLLHRGRLGAGRDRARRGRRRRCLGLGLGRVGRRRSASASGASISGPLPQRGLGLGWRHVGGGCFCLVERRRRGLGGIGGGDGGLGQHLLGRGLRGRCGRLIRCCGRLGLHRPAFRLGGWRSTSAAGASASTAGASTTAAAAGRRSATALGGLGAHGLGIEARAGGGFVGDGVADAGRFGSGPRRSPRLGGFVPPCCSSVN